MPRFDYAKLSMKQRKAIIEPLVETLHSLKTKEQLFEFLGRLLTSSELIMVGRRLQAAERLIQGKSYYTVRKETGIGFSTIQSVDSWLKHIVRDYDDVRAKHRREEIWKKQHARNLKPRLRHGGSPRWLILDLLTQGIAEAVVGSRKTSSR